VISCSNPIADEETLMAKLKLGAIEDDKPVKLTIELPAAVHRDLVAYAEALARETQQANVEPARLVAPMLARFMAADRAFAKARRRKETSGSAASESITKPPAAPAQPPATSAHPSAASAQPPAAGPQLPRDEPREPRPAVPAQSSSPLFRMTTAEPRAGVASPERLNERG
jgi:hypothetical protein